MKDRLLGILAWLFMCAFAIAGWNLGYKSASDATEKAINNSIENIQSLKRDCEKDLPRDQECVLIYEFVPVKTKGE